MGKKKIRVLCDNRYDYDAKVTKEKVTLNFSNDDSWTSHIRGTEIGVLTDDGNSINVKFNSLDLDLDYDELVELHILLSLKIKKDKKLTGKIEFLKEAK